MGEFDDIIKHPTTTKERVVRQLAEEATELSKACIKYLRAIDVDDTTPVTEEYAIDCINEEFADVSIVAYTLSEMGILNDDILSEWRKLKIKRWCTRLNEIGRDNDYV